MSEREIIRGLARQWAQAAQNPRNEENAGLYRAVNGLRMIRPVVLINELPWHELEIPALCSDPFLADVERRMRRTLYQWNHFPADMIVPKHFSVQKVFSMTPYMPEVQEEVLSKNDGNNIISHAYIDQLADDEALNKLRIPVLTRDDAETERHMSMLTDILGNILPVRAAGYEFHAHPWDDISRMRGVTELMIDLFDRPDFSHRMIGIYRDINIAIRDQMEALGLLDTELPTIHCTPALCDELPAEGFNGTARLGDVWGRGTAQIFGSVSKAMHEEFDIDYQVQMMEPVGLVYYGCCEPLHNKVDIVEKIPHLRKVGITPWADVDVGAERLNTRYVLSSKPNPAAVAVPTLNEDALRKELGHILDACKRNGCSVDITLKDISTCGGNPENLVRWERIAMEMVNS